MYDVAKAARKYHLILIRIVAINNNKLINRGRKRDALGPCVIYIYIIYYITEIRVKSLSSDLAVPVPFLEYSLRKCTHHTREKPAHPCLPQSYVWMDRQRK